jgi:hypothetical protein
MHFFEYTGCTTIVSDDVYRNSFPLKCHVSEPEAYMLGIDVLALIACLMFPRYAKNYPHTLLPSYFLL